MSEENAPEVGDGVLLKVERSENGDVSVMAIPIGDVRLTEIQTIIELGLHDHRARAGFR